MRRNLLILAGLMAILFILALSFGLNDDTAENDSGLNDTVAEDNITIEDQKQENYTNEFEERIRELSEYQRSLNETYGKISSHLLPLVDENYPLPPGRTVEDIKTDLRRESAYIPAGETIKVSPDKEKAPADLVFVEMYVYENSSIHIVDPYAYKVTDRAEEFHIVALLVEVGNLTKIAELDGVKLIDIVVPAEHG